VAWQEDDGFRCALPILRAASCESLQFAVHPTSDEGARPWGPNTAIYRYYFAPNESFDIDSAMALPGLASLKQGALSRCDPESGASAVPACGLANRARAASGIMSAGITTGARGAAAGLGQASAGNARKLPRPRKPGLKSKSRGLETSARAAVERREASAPEADSPCERIVRGARRARSANGWQQPLAWRGQFQFAPSGAPPPLIYLEAKQQWLSFLLQNSGAQRAVRTRSLVLSAPAARGRKNYSAACISPASSMKPPAWRRHMAA
jgi:hypothetical protein